MLLWIGMNCISIYLQIFTKITQAIFSVNRDENLNDFLCWLYPCSNSTLQSVVKISFSLVESKHLLGLSLGRLVRRTFHRIRKRFSRNKSEHKSLTWSWSKIAFNICIFDMNAHMRSEWWTANKCKHRASRRGSILANVSKLCGFTS